MFTPLFFRRLVFVLGLIACGASRAFERGSLPSCTLSLLVLTCLVAEYCIRKKYGAAVRRLVPLSWLRLLPTTLPKLPTLPKGSRALLLGVAALAVFLVLPWAVRLFYPAFNAFGPDTINAYTLGACQFFTALTMSYAAWRLLFPGLYAYAAETMEGKILESITSELLTHMPQSGSYDYPHRLTALAERRKITTLTFIVRCVRFLFSVLPFVFFFVQANAALTSALTVVPPSAPVL